MSQHNIIGSEAFNRSPFVIIRSVRAGGMRRRQARTAVAFAAGIGIAVVGGIAAAVIAFGPGIAGG